jgi:lipoate synthase
MEHLPLVRYYTPAEFGALRDDALAMGFKHVESGPLVRSSYHARDQVPSDSPALRGRRARDAATASTVRDEVA